MWEQAGEPQMGSLHCGPPAQHLANFPAQLGTSVSDGLTWSHLTLKETDQVHRICRSPV